MFQVDGQEAIDNYFNKTAPFNEANLINGSDIQKIIKTDFLYFLHKNEEGGEIVYVGQTRNLYQRIKAHSRKGAYHKEFKAVSYLLCKRSELDLLEMLAVQCIDPKDNVRLKDKRFLRLVMAGTLGGYQPPSGKPGVNLKSASKVTETKLYKYSVKKLQEKQLEIQEKEKA